MKSLIATVLLTSSTLTYATNEFRSFKFYGDVVNREDIRAVIPTLVVKSDDVANYPTTVLKAKDADISFFSELSEMLETFAEPSEEIYKPLHPERSCTVHKGFNRDEIPELHTLCIEQKKTLREAFQERYFYNDCQEAFEPELFMYEYQDGDVLYSKLNNVEGLIQNVMRPLSHVRFKANFLTPEFQKELRFLLTKVRMEGLLEKNRRKQKIYQKTIKALESDLCVKGNPENFKHIKEKVTELSQELKEAEEYLVLIDTEGKKQAQRDRAQVETQGLYRPELPYPNLTDKERQKVTMLISAIYWRIRGGGVYANMDSTQWRRLNFTLKTMEVLGEFNGGKLGNSMGLAFFKGLLKGWGEYFDMGTWPGAKDKYYDLTFMTDRGIFQVERAVKTLNKRGINTVALQMAGLQMGPCYYHAYDRNLPKNNYQGLVDSNYIPVIEGHTDWGEICAGAVLGLGLSKSLLKGARD